MKLILLFILLLALARYLINNRPTSIAQKTKSENIVCYFAYIIIICLAAFRSSSVGTDTYGYIQDFYMISDMTFSQIYDGYRSYFIFYFLLKLLTLLGAPLWVWFGFIELLYVSAVARLINKYSKDKILSIILFIILLLNFSFAGLKQVMAMGIMLHSFLYFVEKKYVKSLICFILAFNAHPASLIFIFAYILYFFRQKQSFKFIAGIILAILVFGGMSTMSFFVNLLGDEHYERYLIEDSSYSYVSLFFYILLMLTLIPFYKKYAQQFSVGKYDVNFQLVCVTIVCALQFLASYSPNMFRLAYLYVPFYCILLPNAYSTRSDNDSKIIVIAIFIGIVFYYAYINRNFIYSLA